MMHSRHNLHWWMMMKHMIIKRAKRRENPTPFSRLFKCKCQSVKNHCVQGGSTSFIGWTEKNKASSVDPIFPISFICTIYNTLWLHHNESWFWEKKDYTKEYQEEEEHSLNHDPSGKKFDEIYSCTIILSLSRLFYFLKPMATHLNDKWWEKFNAMVFPKLRG